MFAVSGVDLHSSPVCYFHWVRMCVTLPQARLFNEKFGNQYETD